MSIGTLIKETRSSMGMTQKGLGDKLHISDAYLSEIERNLKPAPRDILCTLTEISDSHRVSMAVAEEVTEGAIYAPWLNGKVDLHRTSVWLRTNQEMVEAIEVFSKIMVTISQLPEVVNDEEKEKILFCMDQGMDVIVGMNHCIEVACKEYGLSSRQIKKRHKQKLINRGYLIPNKKERVAR